MVELTQSDVFVAKTVDVYNEAQAHVNDLTNKRAVKVAEIAAIDAELDKYTKLAAETAKRYPAVLVKEVDPIIAKEV